MLIFRVGLLLAIICECNSFIREISLAHSILRLYEKRSSNNLEELHPIAEETTGWNESFASSDFLLHYWQRRPLLIRNAFPNPLEVFPLSERDYQTLAIDEDVETRIIEQKRGPSSSYRLKHGPFTQKDIPVLPLPQKTKNWTIIFQEVDRHIPQIADLWEKSFSFIPIWRRDDIMISYSTPGGGIGAHVDNYDVFLIQASGYREWAIEHSFLSDREEKRREIPKEPVRLLKNFQSHQSWILNPGDMLYLPPRVPHRGTTVGDTPGSTVSIGFRAINYVQSIFHYWSTVSPHCFLDAPNEAFYRDQFSLPNESSSSDTVSSTIIQKISKDMTEKFVKPFQPGFEKHFHDWLGTELTTVTRYHRRKPKPFFLTPSAITLRNKADTLKSETSDYDDYEDEDEDEDTDDLKESKPFYLRNRRFRIASERIFNSIEEVIDAIKEEKVNLRRCEGVKIVFLFPNIYLNGKSLTILSQNNKLIDEIGNLFCSFRVIPSNKINSLFLLNESESVTRHTSSIPSIRKLH